MTAASTTAMLLAPAILKSKKDFAIIPNEQIQSLDSDNIVIIIELFGGNDGLNTIIPAEDDTYYKIRPSIGIPKNVAVKVNDIYMNPALVQNMQNTGMQRMFEDGRLAIVEGIGYDLPTLSHFRSEDIWLSGINPKNNNNIKLLDGWLGRYFALKFPNFPVEIPAHPLSISLENSIPLMAKSDKGHMGIALTDPDAFYKLGVALTPVDPLMTGSEYSDKEFNFIYTIAKQSEYYSNVVKTAYDTGKSKINANKYSSGTLSQKMKLISSLIAGGLKTNVYYMKISNFDTHAQQVDASFGGGHYSLLNQVAKAISEFMDDAALTGFADRITGMTTSEFGRRAYENGSRGCDHGAASMQFIWGSDKYLNGGYWNNRPKLTDLDVNGNVKYQTDFRVIYTEILEKRFGANNSDISSVFGESFLPLNILSDRASSAEDYIKPNFNKSILINPNPSSGNQTVSFELFKAGVVNISIYNPEGRQELILQNNYLNEGFYQIPFTLNKSGTFICSVTVNNKRYNTKFVVLK